MDKRRKETTVKGGKSKTGRVPVGGVGAKGGIKTGSGTEQRGSTKFG